MAPIDSLERCMAGFQARTSKLTAPDFGTFRPDAVPDRFLGILRHEAL